MDRLSFLFIFSLSSFFSLFAARREWIKVVIFSENFVILREFLPAINDIKFKLITTIDFFMCRCTKGGKYAHVDQKSVRSESIILSLSDKLV